MSGDQLRSLKIKTGVVRRLSKEKEVYEAEVKNQQERIEKLKEQEHQIKFKIRNTSAFVMRKSEVLQLSIDITMLK